MLGDRTAKRASETAASFSGMPESASRTTQAVRKPITVTIARNIRGDDEDDSEVALLSSEATREEFVIEQADDANGAPVKRLMQLKLDTLAVEAADGYWLDTGILSIQ